jgi:putative endonuclease
MIVYILSRKTQRLYVGVTSDLMRRVCQPHRIGAIPGFSRRYGISRLVYYESFGGQLEAIHREKQIKSYARVKKLAMINSSNPEWRDLAEDWFAKPQA